MKKLLKIVAKAYNLDYDKVLEAYMKSENKSIDDIIRLVGED